MVGGWKTGKGGVKVRVTPKAQRKKIGAGRNAKGSWKRAYGIARSMRIAEQVPAYRGGRRDVNTSNPRRLPG